MRAQKYYKRKWDVFEMSSEDGLTVFLNFLYFKMKLLLYLLLLKRVSFARSVFLIWKFSTLEMKSKKRHFCVVLFPHSIRLSGSSSNVSIHPGCHVICDATLCGAVSETINVSIINTSDLPF